MSPAATDRGEPITVTDFRGKQLTLRKPATRIVCLIESALTAIYMLREEGRVVGVSRNVYDGSVLPHYAALDRRIKNRELPAPGNWDFVNIESVIALKPDLVIIWAHQTESIKALEERGLPVFGVFIARKEDVYREIAALGALTGSRKRADKLVEYAKQEILRVHRRVASLPPGKRPSLYYMWSQGYLETSCGGSTVNDLIDLAGGRNVCASLRSEHMTVSMEKVMSWNPDVVVMWYNERRSPSDLMRDQQWKTIKAVQQGRVHQLPEVFLCDLWTLKFTYALKMVAKWVHPELFGDIDLDRERRMMMEAYYGKKL